MFWDFYAACYDTLGWLKPYQDLIDHMQRLARIEPGQRVLDAGCGTGNLSTAVVRSEQPGGPPAVAVDAGDASTPMLGRALKKAKGRTEVRFQHLNLAASLPYEAETYDRILCCNVLYALPDPLATLKEFRRVIKPGGRLVLATPKQGAGLGGLWKAHFQAQETPRDWALTAMRTPLIGAVHVMNMVIMARKKKAQYHFMDEQRLRDLLSAAGFHIETMEDGYAGQNWMVVAEPVTVPSPVVASPVGAR